MEAVQKNDLKNNTGKTNHRYRFENNDWWKQSEVDPWDCFIGL